MEPGQLIFSLLSQAPAVAAVLGFVEKGQQKYRIYPLQAPEPTPYPYLTYQVVRADANSTMGCDLDDEARVQLSLFALTYAEVCALHKVCRAALHNQEVGEASIAFDGYQESFEKDAACYLRTQDYLLDGLAA